MIITNNKDIIELIHTINLWQKLVDHRIIDTSITSHWTSSFADGIDLVKDYDV